MGATKGQIPYLACVHGQNWRRRLHGLDAHDDCWLCDQGLKTADHHIGELTVSLRKYDGGFWIQLVATVASYRTTLACKIGGSICICRKAQAKEKKPFHFHALQPHGSKENGRLFRRASQSALQPASYGVWSCRRLRPAYKPAPSTLVEW